MVRPHRALAGEFTPESFGQFALLRLRPGEKDGVAGDAKVAGAASTFAKAPADKSRIPAYGGAGSAPRTRLSEHDCSNVAGVVFDACNPLRVQFDAVRG